MAGVFSDPSRVVAVGGIVRVLNGCRVEHGELEQVRLPKRGIEVLQVIEYLRAFLIGREAWAHFNALPIISGAFGIFRKDLLKKVGGFRARAIGEDLDLVVRLHRHLQEQNQPYHITFIPDPTCWTEVPFDLRSLARQRARWHKGLLDTLWPNRAMLISIGSVLLEEMTYRRYSDWREVARLLLYAMVEHFPYRQLTMIWRLQGLWQYLRGDLKWREMKRVGTGAGA